MKRALLIVCLVLIMGNLNAQNVGIANTVITPDVSSVLEVRSTNKGILIPRVSLTSRTDATTISNPAFSLLVFHTGSMGLTPAGYYFNYGSSVSPNWKSFATGNGDAWIISGNSGTSAGTHFLGTTDAQDLVFKTSNIEKMRIKTTGWVGIGTTAPSQKMTILDATPFSLGGSATGVDNIYLEDHSSGAGDGNIGASISFSGPYNGGGGTQRRHIAIAGVQETTEEDFIGMAFYTHNTTASTLDMQESMRLSHDGKLGIYTFPNTRLDVNGDISLRESIMSLAVGLNDNVSTANGYSFYYINATGTSSISGLDGGTNGRIIILYNRSIYRITLLNQELTSLFQNRMELSRGDIVMHPDEAITLIYSSAENRWIELAGTNNSQNINDKMYSYTSTTGLKDFNTTTLTSVPGLSCTITLAEKAKVMLWSSGVVRTASIWINGGSGIKVCITMNGVVMNGTQQCVDAINNGTYTGVSKIWSINHMVELTPGTYTFIVKVMHYTGADADICDFDQGGGHDHDYGKLTIMVVEGE